MFANTTPAWAEGKLCNYKSQIWLAKGNLVAFIGLKEREGI